MTIKQIGLLKEAVYSQLSASSAAGTCSEGSSQSVGCCENGKFSSAGCISATGCQIISPQLQAASKQTVSHQASSKAGGQIGKRVAVQLGQRDAALLSDLALYSIMLAEQIQALYFADCSRRRMNQRLQQLVTAGLLVRRPLPLGLSAGQPLSEAPNGIPFVYRLGGAAAPIVASLLGWDVAEVRRLIRQVTPTAAAHALEIARLRVHAEQAVRGLNAQITTRPIKTLSTEISGAVGQTAGEGQVALEFLPERRLHHRYELRVPGGQWRDEVFKPDALIKLAWAGGPWRYWFAEVDLGHTSAAEWKIKASIAVRYRKLGLFQKRYAADDFGTLILTTGDRRRAHLRQLLTSFLPPEDAAHFGIAVFTDITAQGLLASLWHLPGTERVSRERLCEDQVVSLEKWIAPIALDAGMSGGDGEKPS